MRYWGSISSQRTPLTCAISWTSVTAESRHMFTRLRKVVIDRSTPSLCTPSSAGSPIRSGVVMVRALKTVVIHWSDE